MPAGCVRVTVVGSVHPASWRTPSSPPLGPSAPHCTPSHHQGRGGVEDTKGGSQVRVDHTLPLISSLCVLLCVLLCFLYDDVLGDAIEDEAAGYAQ